MSGPLASAILRAALVLALGAALAGCGAAGPPEPPGPPVDRPQDGISVSGTASFGVGSTF